MQHNSAYILGDCEPADFFRYFEEISAIPRGSCGEKKIADYLVDFAISRGLEYYRDEIHNVLIKHPGSHRFRGRPPLLLQGHTDMICEKIPESQHRFMTDRLDLYIDGGLIRARGTSLGADNGAAVAAMLALLDENAENCVPLECLFTSREEIGLQGATAFDYSHISAQSMINLDAELDGEVIVSCSGGLFTSIFAGSEFTRCESEYLFIDIDGLAGGHSGVDINRGRLSANNLMADLLREIRAVTGVRINTILGGLRVNVIARKSYAHIAVADPEAAVAAIERFGSGIRELAVPEDAGFRITVKRDETKDYLAASTEFSDAFIKLIGGIKTGVLAMDDKVADLVSRSRNLGFVCFSPAGGDCDNKTHPGEILIHYSSRSPREDALDEMYAEISGKCAEINKKLPDLPGGTEFHIKDTNRYPGWEYADKSPLRDKYFSVYEILFDKPPAAAGIHAGLECGIITDKLSENRPGLIDAIAIGPTIRNAHSPEECLDIESCAKFMKILRAMVSADYN